MKTYVLTETCARMFIAALVASAKYWKPLWCPPGGDWLSRLAQPIAEWSSKTQQNELLIHASAWTDLQETRLSETGHMGLHFLCILKKKILELDSRLETSRDWERGCRWALPVGDGGNQSLDRGVGHATLNIGILCRTYTGKRVQGDGISK